MTNAFGGFLHTSPLSNLSSSTSHPPDPHSALASNCIRDYFGPVVQTVADALHARGSSTLAELISNIKLHCLKDWNEERGRLVDRLNKLIVANNKNKNNIDYYSRQQEVPSELFHYHGRTTVTMNKARGSESAGFVSDASYVRAALIVLLQHSLVKVTKGGGSSGGSGSNNKQSKKKKNKKQQDDVPIEEQGDDTTSKQKYDPSSPHTHYTYTFLCDKARLLPRYSRYIEHAQSTFDNNNNNTAASEIVECLLFHGRMRCEDVILNVWEDAKKNKKLQLDNDDNEDGKEDENGGDDENSESGNKALKDIVKSFQLLVEGGYVEMIKPIASNQDLDDLERQKEKEGQDDGDGEYEFNMNEDGTIVGKKKTGKKRTRSKSVDDDNKTITKKSKKKKQKTANGENGTSSEKDGSAEDPHHPQILSSLLASQRTLIPHGSVYRVNTSMFHTSLRAAALSRFVSEMYPDESNTKKMKGTNNNSSDDTNNVKHVGAIVHAALTFAARQEHAPLDRILGINESEEERHDRMAEWGSFSPSDIIQYLPETVTKSLKSQVGGLNQNLSTLLVQISTLQYPPVIIEIEDALGHPKGGKYEVCTRQLLVRMRSRIQHRVLTTHHGLVAARIVSVLQMKGHCESDAIAEDVMVPAKEAREILHRLHRDRYINIFDMHQTKTHNTGTAIFLWDVIPSRLYKTVVNNICTALLNLRLRRQHEVEVGKDWMDRAKEAGATEENVHEEDKKKYHAFCMGLERLDCACLQLDETLMVLKDF